MGQEFFGWLCLIFLCLFVGFAWWGRYCHRRLLRSAKWAGREARANALAWVCALIGVVSALLSPDCSGGAF